MTSVKLGLRESTQRTLSSIEKARLLWGQMCQEPLLKEIQEDYGVTVDGDARPICDLVAAASTQCADADELAGFVLATLVLKRCRSKHLRYMLEQKIGRQLSYAVFFAVAVIALGFADDAAIFWGNYRKSGSWGTWVETNYLAKERGVANEAFDLYAKAIRLSDEAGMSESGDHYLPAPFVLKL